MNIPRILIGAAGSGSGKTLLTCALLTVFAEEKKKVTAFKCGPDYIDPMFHQKVLGVPSKNLDTFFTGETLTRSLFQEGAMGADIAVIEGVMGLYDGLGGIRKEGSSYHLAQVTGTPVILVVNAQGMGRSVLPVIKGFLDFDEDALIRGVILNRTSKQFFDTIQREIESVCRIPVLGYLPKQSEIHMESRHLGLIMPGEIADIKGQIRAVAEVLKETLDIKKLLKIAGDAGELKGEAGETAWEAGEPGKSGPVCTFPENQKKTALSERCPVKIRKVAEQIKIGVARDEAFCFYYEDNLSLLEKAGAVLVPFSPMHDSKLPEGIEGLLFGGGYPELYAEELGGNTSLRQQIAERIKEGMPVIAECGGFMYLHETLENMEKREYPMVGAVPGKCFYTGKLVRFGYVELTEKEADFLPEGEKIAGHEFHYFDSTSNGADVTAEKPVSGRSWDCIHKSHTAWMGFPHLYYYSNPEYVSRFLEKAVCYGKRT